MDKFFGGRNVCWTNFFGKNSCKREIVDKLSDGHIAVDVSSWKQEYKLLLSEVEELSWKTNIDRRTHYATKYYLLHIIIIFSIFSCHQFHFLFNQMALSSPVGAASI